MMIHLQPSRQLVVLASEYPEFLPSEVQSKRSICEVQVATPTHVQFDWSILIPFSLMKRFLLCMGLAIWENRVCWWTRKT